MDYEDFFLKNLGLIEQVIRFIARRHHLSATEEEELVGVVRLRLIENDYAVFRKYQERSSLRTYLTTVVRRIYLDWRIASWGKWRPSAEAKRLGPAAVLLERLITRDGLSVDEAIEKARVNHRVELSAAELRALVDLLPSRVPRRWVSDEELADVPARDEGPDDALLRSEASRRMTRLVRALRVVLEGLPPDDALLIKLRFFDGRQVSVIARTQGLDQKALYRRLAGLEKTLRARLEGQGFSLNDLGEHIGDAGEDPEGDES